MVAHRGRIPHFFRGIVPGCLIQLPPAGQFVGIADNVQKFTKVRADGVVHQNMSDTGIIDGYPNRINVVIRPSQTVAVKYRIGVLVV